jgi:hypothetical protein
VESLCKTQPPERYRTSVIALKVDNPTRKI